MFFFLIFNFLKTFHLCHNLYLTIFSCYTSLNITRLLLLLFGMNLKIKDLNKQLKIFIGTFYFFVPFQTSRDAWPILWNVSLMINVNIQYNGKKSTWEKRLELLQLFFCKCGQNFYTLDLQQI